MKKIITAIGNTNLNERLVETKKYEVVAKDIQYKEGILEILNIKSNIDILIVSEILDGEMEFKELINRVFQINEKIEVIVFIEQENIELKSFLYSKGISKIYINNEIDIDTLIINLEDNIEEKTNELNEEIRKLKEIIRIQEEGYITKKKNGKIITITGAYGSGKSLITYVVSKEFAKNHKKTLVIDFDVFNSSLNVMFGVLKSNEIIKISEYEHLLCIYDNGKFLDIGKMLKQYKENYDEILIDTSSNYNYKYLKTILEIADNIIYIVVPTISEIKKAIFLYEIYKIDFKVPNEKIKVVTNKVNNYSVDDSIVSNIFNKKKISGKIKYRDNIKKINAKIDLLV